MPRIASLLPSATEIVGALGLVDQLVGVSHECDYPPAVARLPRLTVGRQNKARRADPIGIRDAPGMLELVAFLLATVRALLRRRGDLVVENLLLRHQLAVLTRPTRKRPRLRGRDKALWLLARRFRADWRRHLIVVQPETVNRPGKSGGSKL